MRRKLNIIRDKGVDDIPTFKCRSNRRLKSLKYLERPTRVSDLIRLGTTSDIDLRKIAKSLGIPNLRVDWGSAAPKNFEDIPSIFNNHFGTAQSFFRQTSRFIRITFIYQCLLSAKNKNSG